MRKLLFFVVLLLLCITILEINNSFGLFETNNTITVDSNIAKWQVKVNNSNITDPVSFVVDNYVVENDSMVKAGLIAPGMTAYFDIEIDPNDTDVSIRYDITLDMDELENDRIQITNVEEIDNHTIVLTDESTYTGIIPITDSETHTIRIYVEWVNDENNNEIDSLYGLDEDSEVGIPIVINFSQYLNETITQYVGS